MVLTVSFVLSPVIGFIVTVISRVFSQDLTPASRRQDHTTSPYASASFVRALFARLTLPRPPHPVPYVRDDRETPLCVGRDGKGYRVDLGRQRSEIFFTEGLDRILVICPVGQIH